LAEGNINLNAMDEEQKEEIERKSMIMGKIGAALKRKLTQSR